MIDPIIRKQLARQYAEWNNARSRLKGELKCNRCKNYFPRAALMKVYPGPGRYFNWYCDECYAKRKSRGGGSRREDKIYAVTEAVI